MEGCLVDNIYLICNIYKVKGGYVVYKINSYTQLYIKYCDSVWCRLIFVQPTPCTVNIY